MEQPDCYVGGEMATMLRLSRLAGVAPLQFVKKGLGWRVSYSPGWSYYGYFVITILMVVSTSVLVVDLHQEPGQSVRVNSRTAMYSIVAIATSMSSMVIVTTSVFGAPALMRSFIACMNRVQKINFELISLNINKRKNSQVFFISMTVTVTLLVLDYGIGVTEWPQMNQTQIWISLMLSSVYCCYWVQQMRVMQFVMVTLHVRNCFKGINTSLKNLLRDLAQGNELLMMTLFDSKISKVTTKAYLKKTPSKIADSWNSRSGFQTMKSNSETVRRLALAYTNTCDVVRHVDDAHGLVVLMLLGSFLLHLVSTPYYLIICLYKEYTSNTDWTKHVVSVVLQAIWCFYHAANLLVVIEPCHLTLVEMENTCDLVSHMIRCIDSAHDPLAMELEMFLKHLFLNKASYSAKHVATVSRPLLATIVGCITTYLVILIQL